MFRKPNDNKHGWMKTHLSFPADLASSPDPGSCDLNLTVLRANVA